MKPKEGVFSIETGAGDGALLFDGLAIEIKLAPGQPAAVVEQAVKDADAARQRYPLSRAIARQYGEALIASGKFEEATRYLRDALASDVKALTPHMQGQAHELLERTTRALNGMDAVVAQRPEATP